MALSIKQKQLLDVLRGNLCNISKACLEVGVSRNAHYQYMKQNKQYFTAYEDIEASLLDDVETKAYEFSEIEPSMVQFILKTKGKKRGWSEKIEIEHSGTVTEIVETIILPDEA